MKNIINRTNIFKSLYEKGFKVSNVNVYRDDYLKMMLDINNRKIRPSVTSVMSMSIKLKFRCIREFNQGLGVYHDITGEKLFEEGYINNMISEKQAAKVVSDLLENHDVLLFEHFMCDIIGHKKDMKLALSELEKIDNFLGGLINFIDLKNNVIFITSDHGNIEDLSVKTHTNNLVPTIIINETMKKCDIKITNLCDIEKVIKYIVNKG